jgi:2-dehydro-3-deoxyphosphooctonate aldolase (KDO 8-P synthase)
VTTARTLRIRNVEIGNDLALTVIAGPCQLESRDHAFMMAGTLKEMAERLGVGLIYKTSFDKANRTSLAGKRGLGLDASLSVFEDLRKELRSSMSCRFRPFCAARPIFL